MITAVDAVGTFPTFTYVLLIAPRVSFCRNAMSMHLASDYIHPYKDAGGRRARCRVRIYLPEDVLDAPVVVCSELPNNPGGSITNSAETIAAGVIRANELPSGTRAGQRATCSTTLPGTPDLRLASKASRPCSNGNTSPT